MSKVKQIDITDKVLREFGEFMAKETLKLLETQGKSYGKQFAGRVIRHFLTSLVEIILTSSLVNEKSLSLSEKARYKVISQDFEDTKMLIQNSVAQAFERVISRFSKDPVSYYCLIRPTPEPTSEVSH